MRAEIVGLLRCPATGAPLTLDSRESEQDRTVYGVLESATEAYPVLAGVPVLLPGMSRAAELVRVGRYAEAAAAALWIDLTATARGRLSEALGLFGRTQPLARRLEQADQRRLTEALAPLLRADAPDPMALIRLAFEGWGSPNPEAVGYFTYRFGTPRHLVSLAVAEAVDVGGGLVLDLGCGAGHLTWGLGQMFGADRIVSLDLSLIELWAARGIAGPVDLVCGDATSLPLRSSLFTLVLSSDVLSFVHQKWSAAREAMRVATPDGTIAVTAVKNALVDHVYAGMPLPPEGWVDLFDPLEAHLLADRRILDDYFEQKRLDLPDRDAALREAHDAPTVTVLAGTTGPRLKAPARFDRWPHGIGPLGVNPLMASMPSAGPDLVYARRWPTERFAPDNPPLSSYLPERLTLPISARNGNQLDPEQVQDHIASTAVLALPDLYRGSSPRPAAAEAASAP